MTTSEMPVTFPGLRTANQQRLPLFQAHFGMMMDDWTLGDWGCALAGEVGELCNLIKKVRRNQNIRVSHLAQELADVVIYADLLAAKLGIDLGEAVRLTFNNKSDELNLPVKFV